MAISQYKNNYFGLSTDSKPTGTSLNGRGFEEMDTGKKYRFDAENQQWLQQAGGGGGGGSSTLSGLTDVDISNPSDGQTLVYDATSGKWVNGSAGGAGATILQATFELSEMGEVVTLAQTAAELFALCSAGLVFIAYTVPAGTYDPDDPVNRYMPVLNFATSTQGDTTAYLFVIADVMSGNQQQTDPLAPTDTVVFMSPR